MLVADDEEFCQASMGTLLQKTGFDVKNRLDFCINGVELVNLVRNSFELGINYRLIFSDFSMPDMDGVEAVAKVRDFFKA